MHKFLNILISFFLVFLFTVITVIFYLINKYNHDLPSYEQLKSYTPKVTTRLYSADGTLINEFSKENRVFVPIEIIPKHLINAFLSAEDSNFYNHHGIDVLAITRAVIKNILALAQGKSLTGGASTITQQVVKNFLLSNQKTIERKVKEAILAFRITQYFSKEKVLELYLNQIYLGSGSYGVAAAAQEYFNKSIDELAIEEVALLATLPKSPSRLDPRKNIEGARARRDWVINRMLEERFITTGQARIAKSKPIIITKKSNKNITKANFFSSSVKRKLIDLYGSNKVFESGIVVRTTLDLKLQKYANLALQKGLEQYDKRHGYRGVITNLIYQGNEENKFEELKISKDSNWLEKVKNIKIKKSYKSSWKKAIILDYDKNIAKIGIENNTYGTIDLKNIRWAREYISVNKVGDKIKQMSDVFKIGDVILVEKIEKDKYSLQQIPIVNGGVVAMNPHTGRVLAMSGGYIDGLNKFNRVTQAKRQPGSVLKTFGYLAALENGLNPTNIILDEEITLDQGEDLPPYKPVNFSQRFYGPTTIRRGLERSINVTTIRMIEQIGLDKVVEITSRFNINKNPKYIYSLVLGSTETTLLQLANAYSMIVNGGKKIKPAMIEKIQDRNGKTIYKRDNRTCSNCILDKDINYKNAKIPNLSEERQKITDPNSAYQIVSMLEGAINSGTGYKARSIKKVLGGKTGTTNNSLDSWFIGFSPDLVVGVYVGFDSPKTLGIRETGSSVALPIFVDFMKNALKDVPSTPFRVPEGIKFVKIDRNTGRPPTSKTRKNHIIFEALKLNDKLEEGLDLDRNDYELEQQFDYNNNIGIY